MPRMILSPGNTIKVAVKHSVDLRFHCRKTIINLTSIRAWLFKGSKYGERLMFTKDFSSYILYGVLCHRKKLRKNCIK